MRLEKLVNHVTPKIQGRRTLWFSIGGPHLAFGGEPVKSVALLHFDTYNVRSEAGLMEVWQRQPPDFVFMSYYLPGPGSQLFSREAMTAWLNENYTRAWQDSETDSTLWELKSEKKTIQN
jgi:hypothetical protein